MGADESEQERGMETVYSLLFAISFAHLLNDMLQVLLPSIYPLLRDSYGLTFSQLGIITFTYQLTASVFQPVVGHVTDRHPFPYSLAVGMCFTLSGIMGLALSKSYVPILCSAGIMGCGSAIFHPEASRIAHMAAGQRKGFAQSFFQVGGNAGMSLSPLAVALFVVPHGQQSLAFFSAVGFGGALLLWRVGQWQKRNFHRLHRKVVRQGGQVAAYPRQIVIRAMSILVLLIFTKYIYLASFTSYFTFYLIDRFHLSVRHAQYMLFLQLFAVALGTIIGGPVGDRIGRKRVIWFSILGAAPFALLLPHAGLWMTGVLVLIIGVIIASAFSAIVVYAQELMPGKVGMVAGLFFGLAFGTAGISAAVLGKLADHTSVRHVFEVCAYLPLLGLLAVFLPDVRAGKESKV